MSFYSSILNQSQLPGLEMEINLDYQVGPM